MLLVMLLMLLIKSSVVKLGTSSESSCYSSRTVSRVSRNLRALLGDVGFCPVSVTTPFPPPSLYLETPTSLWQLRGWLF